MLISIQMSQEYPQRTWKQEKKSGKYIEIVS